MPEVRRRKLAAIMFTDLVGYSALSQKNEALALELLKEHQELLRPLFVQYNGTEIKTIGDAFLVEFASAVEAANCAIAIQKAMTSHTSVVAPERRIQVRIGLHVGDVVIEEDDVLGDGVNVASRIEPLAPTGGICVSGDVAHQIRNKIDYPLQNLGDQKLKNIEEPVTIYSIELPWLEKVVPSRRMRPVFLKSDVMRRVGIGVAVLLVLLVAWWLLGRRAIVTEPGQIRSIAVLPLENLMGDPDQEYFVDGMTEEITARLSEIEALKVIARTSVMQYKHNPQPAQVITRELGIDGFVEGSITEAEGEVRVTVKLVDGNTGEHLWNGRYQRELHNILALQSEVALAIANEIRASLTPEEEARLSTTRQVNPEAYQLYLEGWYSRQQEDRESIQRAIEHLEQAVALDSTFALAWANLGIVYGIAWDLDLIERTEASAKARYSIEQALNLDPELAQAYVSKGVLIYYIDRLNVMTVADWDEAEVAFRRSVELNPGLLDAQCEYGGFLQRSGRYEEAISHFLKAQELSPLSHDAYEGLGWTYYSMGEYDRAVNYFQRAVDLNATSRFAAQGLRYSLQPLLRQQGRFDELLAWGRENGNLYALTAAYIGLGYADSAAALLPAPLEETTGGTGIRLRAIFGDQEGALDLLEAAFESLSLGEKRWTMSIYHGLFYDLHDHPRYQALMAQTGLQY